MTEHTVAKLRKHLARPVEDEPGVVYLLCQVRKLLETDPRGPKPVTLWMCCHWALNLELSQSSTVDFLKCVDKFINTVVGFGEGRWSFLDEQHLFQECVYVDTFRSQLQQVLAAHGLPDDICTDPGRWIRFLAAYASVIEDGHVAVNSKSVPLQLVEKVVMRGSSHPCSGNDPFAIRWDIYLKDGRICRMETEAGPGANAISHHISLTAAGERV